MRTRLALSTLLLLLVAGCGGTTGATTKPAATGGTGAPAGSGSTGQPPGAVDCTALATAGQQLIAVQLLAQLRTPETVASIRDKAIGNLDLDAFLAGMATLHALDAFASPLGDPKEAIDTYEKAARAAQVLFATDPITQAAIDTYNAENVGTVAEFLGHGIAISGALDEAGC